MALKPPSSNPRLEVVTGRDTPAARAIEQLWRTGNHDGIDVDPDDAAEAIELLSTMELPDLVNQMIAGGERLAEHIHSVATRGLQEVVQNAEDQQAKNVRFGYRLRSAGTGELLVVHDGKPVELADVLRMAFPLVSGSRSDSEKIGQFGVGLKTLNQLGPSLQVHCRPLPGFAVEKGRITKADVLPSIKGFWDAEARETLLILRLARSQFDLDFFQEWLSAWDASSLLFLDHVSSVSLVDLGRRRRTVISCGLIRTRSTPARVDLPKAVSVRETELRDAATSRRWTRYDARFATPRSLTSDDLGETLDIRIAVPNREGRNRVYVGLPLEEDSTLPFSVGSKHLKLSGDRTDLLQAQRNEWLIKRIGHLATAVALSRLTRRPRTAWKVIPLSGDGCGNSEWIRAQFAAMIERQRAEIHKGALLRFPDGQDVPFRDLVYVRAELADVLEPPDVERLWKAANEWDESGKAIPKSWRDGKRWLQILADHGSPARPLNPADALAILHLVDEELDARGTAWLVNLVAAGLACEESAALQELRCIALAHDKGRTSPAAVRASGALLVHSLPRDGLAASLGTAQQIAQKFRSNSAAATAVRSWLKAIGALQEKPVDADAIRSLAGGDGSSPVDLRRRDSVLKRLRNSFEQLPAQTREELGPGVGSNIQLRGYAYEKGTKKTRAVRPADAYLPSQIDSSPFPKAAGKTLGLEWISSGYRDLLRRPQGLGAMAFLRQLGAATAPRLVPGPPPTNDRNAPQLITRRGLNAHQKEELARLPNVSGLRNDWYSPDALAVAEDIAAERNLDRRRQRARGLILAFAERWPEYADRVSAEAVNFYYGHNHKGEVTATWLSLLTSTAWLTTREPGRHPAAPRDLSVLTESSFDLEGANLVEYAAELDAEHADLDIVSALGIEGRPSTEAVVNQLQRMKDADRAGQEVSQKAIEHCYRALQSHLVAVDPEEAEATAAGLRRDFSDPGKRGGLISASGQWLAPNQVRAGPPLHPSLPTAPVQSPILWKKLGILGPTLKDCLAVMDAMAEDESADLKAELALFDRLLAMAAAGTRGLGALKSAPLRLHTAGTSQRSGTVFAMADTALASNLGRQWKVWDPPMPLTRLKPLLKHLGVQVLTAENFTPEIPKRLLEGESDLQVDYSAAVGRLYGFLKVNHPDLANSLEPEDWSTIARAKVILSTDWRVRVQAPGKRSQSVSVQAAWFENPMVFCATGEDQLSHRGSGGRVLASRIAGLDAPHTDISLLALAWNACWNDQTDLGIGLDIDPTEEPHDAPSFGGFKEFERKTSKRNSRRRPNLPPKPPKEARRELVNAADIDLSKVAGLLLEGRRKGATIRASRKAKLINPRPSAGRSGIQRPTTKLGLRDYSERDKEDLALSLVAGVLLDQRGIELEDIRGDHNAGADGVDRKHDFWVELKASGTDMPEIVRLEPSQVERAEEKRGQFLLAIVWGLEKPRTPAYVLISDPLRRLDRRITGKMHLSGIADLLSKSSIG